MVAENKLILNYFDLFFSPVLVSSLVWFIPSSTNLSVNANKRCREHECTAMNF